MNYSEKYNQLYQSIFDLYHLPENKAKLLFHGWHHIKFVHDKAIEFATELAADVEIVASAALVHDLNYIFTDKLEPEAANAKVEEYLRNAGFEPIVIERIKRMIEDENLGYRADRNLDNESKALSDADTLFKVIPTTPILFASKFITQNKYDYVKLATKVATEQRPLIDNNIFFYTESARQKYMPWAIRHLELWESLLEAVKDPAIKEMLDTASELGVL